MLFPTIVSALAFASAVWAQNITVQVGAETTTQGGIFQYMPSSFNATNGSVITFEFSGTPGNHSVTQSSFSDPCNPLSGGFDSGWVFIPDGLTDGFPTWNLTITDDSKPIWFYCKQLVPAPHCQAGMVGGINVAGSGSNTFSAFQNAAISSSGTPGQGQGFIDGQGANSSGPAGPLSGSISAFGAPTATAPSSSASTSGSSGSSGSSSGAAPSPTNSASGAEGVVVNSVVVLLAALVGITLA